MVRWQAYLPIGALCVLIGVATIWFAPYWLAYSQRRRANLRGPLWFRRFIEARARWTEGGYVPSLRLAGALTIIFGIVVIFLGFSR